MSQVDTLKDRFPGLGTAAALVLDYLLPPNAGKAISNLIAINVLGQGSLTSRISEIRKWLLTDAGKKLCYEVKAAWKTDTARNKRYKSYQIVTLKVPSPSASA